MKHTFQPNSESEIIAMENLRFIVDNSEFPDGSCFAYNVVYLTYETNKVYDITAVQHKIPFHNSKPLK